MDVRLYTDILFEINLLWVKYGKRLPVAARYIAREFGVTNSCEEGGVTVLNHSSHYAG